MVAFLVMSPLSVPDDGSGGGSAAAAAAVVVVVIVASSLSVELQQTVFISI